MPDDFRKRMRRLLAPQTIAFIGGGVAEMCIRRCQEMGYAGKIWPVHPRRERIAGLRCYRSVSELPGAPDAAYVGVNHELTVEVVGQLAAAGSGGCVCYAAGFAEIGGDGVGLQQALREAADGMPVVGPNTFGLINHANRCSLWPYLFGGERVERGPALISQSGNIGMNLTMNRRSLNFTYVIGAGNQAVLGPGHYIEALLDDDRVTAIGMYIEGFDDIAHFSNAAAQALHKGVPIVVVKAGRTEASARQTSSHTSALTGSDELYDALFDRLGIVRVDTLNQLLETLKVLDFADDVSGRNILTLSCSGGEAALIADAAPGVGLNLPEFTDQQAAELMRQFPDWVTVSNPFDYNTSIWGDRAGLERCFTTAMQGEHDAAFLVYDHPTVDSPPEVDEWLAALHAFIAAHEATGKPAYVLCTISELLPREIRDYMIDHGVHPLQGLEEGLYAYAAAAGWHEARRRLTDPVVPPRPAASAPKNATALDEFQAKMQLSESGLRVPESGTGAREDVARIANRIGYPVVAKALGTQFVHKSDLGAVKIDLHNDRELLDAVDEIVESCNRHGIGADNFLVEKMVEGAIAELIVGVKRDQQFGLALVVGAGGVLVELIGDARSLLLPASRADVEGAIRSLSVARVLDGFRGGPKGDINAAVDAVLAVAKFAEANWSSLDELDINPLLVLEQGAIAADALVFRT